MADTKKNPFEVKTPNYEKFPDDEFIDVSLTAYQQADLPPGPLAKTNDPVPSVRFLFAGYVKNEDGTFKVDEQGNKIVVRKWTGWLTISNAKNAKIMKLFNGFENLFDILQDCFDATGKLWTQPFKILLNSDGEYQNIISIKPGKNETIGKELFYDKSYTPYKVVKAYGKPVFLTLAGCKFDDGVKTFQPEEMAEPSSSDN